MRSLKDLRSRMKSIRSTQKITSAMKMVAASKFRKVQALLPQALAYEAAVKKSLSLVAKDAKSIELTACEIPADLIIVWSTDRGLCGGFHGTMLKKVLTFADSLIATGRHVDIWCTGSKAFEGIKRQNPSLTPMLLEISSASRRTDAKVLTQKIYDHLESKKASRVFLCYSHFKSVLVQEPSIYPLIPIHYETFPVFDGEVLLEPPSCIDALLFEHVTTQCLVKGLETDVGEQAARMTAMDSATRNAKDVIESLELTYNRTRQALITEELIEVISSSEIL